MTDREEFEKWWGVKPEERSLNMSLADNLTMYDWQAWQARGELDAVRIKELEEKLNDTKNYHIEWCGANVKIAELTAKLDKAREAFGEIVLGKVFDQDNKDFCQTTLEELDK